MKHFDWPSAVYRAFAITNFAIAVIGSIFLVSSVLAVLLKPVGNTPAQPYFLTSYWAMTVANICFLSLLVLGGIYLLQLRATGVTICNIVFFGEILYFLVIGFLWFPAWPRVISMSVGAATGVGNMGLSPQLISGYPLIGLVCLNLARWRRQAGIGGKPMPVLRKIFLGIALLIIAVISVGLHLMHRHLSKWEQESREQLQKLEPRVITGDREFTKKVFYSSSELGEVTQILVGWPANREAAALTVLGNKGVHFLDASARPKKQVTFSKFIASPLQAVQLDAEGDYGFLTRDQSWAVDVILFDKSGQEVWNYSGGIDDSIVGEVDDNGKSTVVVGLNGGGGLVLVNSQGKKIWRKPEGNVWHVETLDIKGDGHREIVHTNAGGELLVRNATGEVIAHYLPGYYVSHFSLTRWGNELEPTHILVPTEQNKEGCCKDVLLVLDAAGNSVASLDAPKGDWIHKVNGTPVQQKEKSALYAVLQTGVLPRSLLSIYNSEGKIIYQEILGDRCLAINTMPGDLADRLLIGCASSVWEYYSLPMRP